VATSATATSALADDLFKGGDELLKNRIDKLMVSYKTTEPRFYTLYDNAQKIVFLGSHSRSGETELDEVQ